MFSAASYGHRQIASSRECDVSWSVKVNHARTRVERSLWEIQHRSNRPLGSAGNRGTLCRSLGRSWSSRPTIVRVGSKKAFPTFSAEMLKTALHESVAEKQCSPRKWLVTNWACGFGTMGKFVHRSEILGRSPSSPLGLCWKVRRITGGHSGGPAPSSCPASWASGRTGCPCASGRREAVVVVVAGVASSVLPASPEKARGCVDRLGADTPSRDAFLPTEDPLKSLLSQLGQCLIPVVLHAFCPLGEGSVGVAGSEEVSAH